MVGVNRSSVEHLTADLAESSRFMEAVSNRIAKVLCCEVAVVLAQASRGFANVIGCGQGGIAFSAWILGVPVPRRHTCVADHTTHRREGGACTETVAR